MMYQYFVGPSSTIVKMCAIDDFRTWVNLSALIIHGLSCRIRATWNRVIDLIASCFPLFVCLCLFSLFFQVFLFVQNISCSVVYLCWLLAIFPNISYQVDRVNVDTCHM